MSAINAVSVQLFNNLNVWQDIIAQRAQPYHDMHIWDKAGYGQLDFALKDVNHKTVGHGPEQLGFIVENKAITMEKMQNSWKLNEISKINQVIIAGFISKYSFNEIKTLIKGTRKNKFKDGELISTKRNSDAIVKTQGNHVTTM